MYFGRSVSDGGGVCDEINLRLVKARTAYIDPEHSDLCKPEPVFSLREVHLST